MGRPVVIYWSLKEPDESEYDTTTSSSRNWIFSLIDSILRLPVETRWHRMLKEVH